MRVGVIQSSFIPWRGYFDFIASVDVFIFLDDVQYTSRDWRNRNKIKTPKGAEWLTVPVLHQSQSQLICETFISEDEKWRKKHLGAWVANYRATPYFRDILKIISDLQSPDGTISQLNIDLAKGICRYLNIQTPLLVSTDLSRGGDSTARLIDLVRGVGGRTYLSGPSAEGYLDKQAFRDAGIGLEYKSYNYEQYPQRWGAFDGAVTVLDLIANCGPMSKNFIRSKTPNRVVIE